MSKPRLGWKIVKQTADGFRSATHSSFGIRTYAVGVWTSPLQGYGPLGVFNTQNNALQFAWQHCCYDNNHPAYLCRCEYVKSAKTKMYVPAYPLNNEGSRGLQKLRLCVCPKGTVLATRVRLINAELIA